MAIEIIRAYKTSDGKPFESETEAKDHEFEIAISAWAKDATDEKGALVLLACIVPDRMKLAPIFRLLNGGGTPIVLTPPPAKVPTDGQ